jgi:hypothetical protein
LALAFLEEAIEQMGILAHHQMRMQDHRLADCRQTVQGGHRHFQLITEPVHIHNQMRRLLFRQGAAQTSDHRCAP